MDGFKEKGMKDALRIKNEYDWSAICFGSILLVLLLSQYIWQEWQRTLQGPRILLFIENSWYYMLALIAVLCYETWQLIFLLRRKNKSIWWIMPLILLLFGVAAMLPSWIVVKMCLAVAFIAIHYLLFIDRWRHGSE
jgi:hypothetical protein